MSNSIANDGAWRNEGGRNDNGRRDSGTVCDDQPPASSHLLAPRWSLPKLLSWMALEKLELIGLLMHEAPVVYESQGLPDMKTIAEGDVPTRPLTAFESTGLLCTTVAWS